MRVSSDPPLTQWRLGRDSGGNAAREAMRGEINARAELHGGATLAQARQIIGTGHQPWLWHPGILAKDIAAGAAARHHGAGVFHLVVDQDAHEVLRLDLPVLEGDRLRIETLHLAPENVALPSACQPPADADLVRRNLEAAAQRLGTRLRADFGPLLAAFTALPPCATLAQQMGIVTQRLMKPWAGDIPLLYATDLGANPVFADLIQRMLHDARHCVGCYNRAVSRHPDARVAPLGEELDRVELPLWALQFGQPRRRLFADLSDTDPVLALESGEIIDLAPTRVPARRDAADREARETSSTSSQSQIPNPKSQILPAPRALLMTAFLRRWCCDLFIHGKGGGVYDRITEDWWREWTGKELAPMAVVSADVHLPLNAPVADHAQRDRAVWWVHHLPHNIDRTPGFDGTDQERITRKRDLLAHMDDDRDRRRRAAAFAELHQINAGFAASHPHLIADASRKLELAGAGLANRAIAQKRDWCFALYPPEQMEELRKALLPLAPGERVAGTPAG